MTDDIVTRLRGQVSAEKPCFPKSYLTEAADEIERLRVAGDMLFQMLGDIHAWTADGEIEALNAWQEARLGSFIHPIGTVTYGIEDMYER